MSGLSMSCLLDPNDTPLPPWGVKNSFLICKVADLEMWISFVITKQNYLSSVTTGKLVGLCVVIHLWHSHSLHFLSQYWSTCKNTSLRHPCWEASSRVIWHPCENGLQENWKMLILFFIFLPKTSRCFLSCPFLMAFALIGHKYYVLQEGLFNQYSNQKYCITLLRLLLFLISSILS